MTPTAARARLTQRRASTVPQDAHEAEVSPVAEEQPVHVSVLLDAVLDALAPAPGHDFIDATIGLGGHAEAILAATNPDGRLLGIDADADAVERSRRRLLNFAGRAMVIQGNFRDLDAIAVENDFGLADGVLFDLGVSSLQLSAAGRGFSFQYDAPLDMRMDPRLPQTAAEIVNGLDTDALSGVLKRFGEEPAARRIARAIVRQRPIHSTAQLARIVSSAVGRPGSRTHPATRTFQALRIAVNDELSALRAGLTGALRVLRSGGRLVVISFHSLEDRIVKEFLRRESQDCVCPPSLPACVCSHRASLRVLRRSVQRPSEAEIAANPRSRSAKLRLAERI